MPRAKMSNSEEFPLLKGLGLTTIAIVGDGNCLFYALSHQLYGTTGRHAEIRANVVDHMRNNAADFKPFINYDGERRSPKRRGTGTRASSAETSKEQIEKKINAAWEKYLKLMAKSRTWGDNLAIRAFACSYNRTVRVYQTHGDYDVSPDEHPGDPVACIAYHTWRHFSSVCRIDDSSVGLPDARTSVASETNKVEDWMMKSIPTSPPHSLAKCTVRQSLAGSMENVNVAVDQLSDEPSSPPSTAPTSPNSSFTSISEDMSSQDSENDGSIRGQISTRRILATKKITVVRLDVDHSTTSSPLAFSQCGTSTFDADDDEPVRGVIRRKRKNSTNTDTRDIPYLDLNDSPSISAASSVSSQFGGISAQRGIVTDGAEALRGSKRRRQTDESKDRSD